MSEHFEHVLNDPSFDADDVNLVKAYLKSEEGKNYKHEDFDATPDVAAIEQKHETTDKGDLVPEPVSHIKETLLNKITALSEDVTSLQSSKSDLEEKLQKADEDMKALQDTIATQKEQLDQQTHLPAAAGEASSSQTAPKAPSQDDNKTQPTGQTGTTSLTTVEEMFDQICQSVNQELKKFDEAQASRESKDVRERPEDSGLDMDAQQLRQCWQRSETELNLAHQRGFISISIYSYHS